MTLLDLLDNKRIVSAHFNEGELAQIRRWRAIAQAVKEGGTTFLGDKDAIIVLDWIMRRADELLRGEGKP